MGKKIIIKGADFSLNAIPQNVIVDDAVYVLVNGVSIDETTTPVKMISSNTRSLATVTKGSVDNPYTWNSASVSQADTYSLIPIPEGAVAVTIECTNTQYWYGLNLRTASGERIYNSGWMNGGSASVYLSSYPSAVYVSSLMKIGSAGTTAFTNETLTSIGWKITWS